MKSQVGLFRFIDLSQFLLFVIACVPTMVLCGNAAAGNTSSTGLLKGTVTIGPLCPVEPCKITPEQAAEAYAARKVIVYNSDQSSVIKEISLDKGGAYKVELAAGQYVIDINHAGMDRSPDVPKAVTVNAGETVTVDIEIDTGMR